MRIMSAGSLAEMLAIVPYRGILDWQASGWVGLDLGADQAVSAIACGGDISVGPVGCLPHEQLHARCSRE